MEEEPKHNINKLLREITEASFLSTPKLISTNIKIILEKFIKHILALEEEVKQMQEKITRQDNERQQDILENRNRLIEVCKTNEEITEAIERLSNQKKVEIFEEDKEESQEQDVVNQEEDNFFDQLTRI